MVERGSALVTGSNRGIGRAIALGLADEGFRVVATMRDPASGTELVAAAEARGVADTIEIRRLDVTDPTTFDVPDDLTVLVNNAGFDGPRVPVEELSDEDLRDLFETNFFGPVALIRRAVPVLRRNGGGVICGITTQARLVMRPFVGGYRASKSATAALLETLRAEVAPFGIRVIEVLPGPIDTGMVQHSTKGYAAPPSEPYRDLAVRIAQRRASPRDGTEGTSVSRYEPNHPPFPVEGAARRIIEAILAPDGPLRYGCDALSDALLEAWRSVDNEVFLADTLEVIVGAEPARVGDQ